MKGLVVVRADADLYGARKENVFLAMDADGEHVGSLLIYPYVDHDIEPEHPHNLYLHLQAAGEGGMTEAIKDVLLERALVRAAEIKREERQPTTRVYACFLKDQDEELAFFLTRGFMHDESMLIPERDEATLPPQPRAPDGVAVRAWTMDTDAEQHRFIEAHRTVFPRHAYSTETLVELKTLPGWRNFTAFSDAEIAGNIMVYTKEDGGTVGYIEDLFVRGQWRRRGIAKFLLYTALACFHSADIRRVQLEFWSANRAALGLYRAFGFSAVGETEIAVGRYV